MKRPHSLRRQLWWWLVLLHLVATALTATLSYRAYQRLVDNFMDEQMRLVADSYSGGRKAGELPRLPDEKAIASGAFVVQLWSTDGTELTQSSWPAVALPLQPAPGFRSERQRFGNEDSWRIYTAAPGPNAGPARVQVIQSDAFRRTRATRRALLETLPIVLLLPVSLLVLWLIVAAGTRTLRGVAHEVAAQDEHSVAELPVTRVPEEIGPLVAAFNSVLSRLRDALLTQRRFVQDAAHELRTPITAIGLQIENLRPLIEKGEASERFAQLDAGVTRARHLTEQLLRLSRQDAPPPANGTQPIDLEAVLRDSVGQLMPLADLRGIDLGFEGRGRLAVSVPTPELRTVFDNLIDNALRHAPEGGRVDVHLEVQDGCTVVEVIDNGPGIAPEHMARVFDRFFRVPGAPPGGSGLGLSIAQGAAVRNGFRISLRNRAHGQGLVARVAFDGASRG